MLEVKNFIGDRNRNHLSNANAHADQFLPQLALLPVIRSVEGVKGLRESVTSFRQSAGQLLRHLEEDASEISSTAAASKQRLEELARDITDQRLLLAQISADFQGQFSQAQEARLNESSEAAKQRTEEFRLAQSQRGETFQVFLEEREEVLRVELQERQKRLDDIEQAIEAEREKSHQMIKDGLSSLDGKVTTSVAFMEKQSNTLLAEMQHQKEQAERLLAVIGEMGITSGYQKVANRAWKVAWFWHAVTIASLMAIIIIAYEAFLPLVKGNFSWESFAGRVFVTATVAALAAYAAHQADKNGRIERENRRIELDLASIGPFLAEMPEEKQEEFRMTLANRTFGREETTHHFKEDKSPVSAIELVKSKELREFIREVVLEAVKAAKS